jgi:hypothetical protein
MDPPPSPPSPPSPPPPPSRETDVAFGLILLMLGLAACVYAAVVVRREAQRQRDEQGESYTSYDPSYTPNYTPSDVPSKEDQKEQMLANIPPTELTSFSTSGFPAPRHLDQFRKGVA